MTGGVAMDLAKFATAFDQAADIYERSRPGYPAEAIDWLLPADARVLLDLAAGTGKLTRLLLRPGYDVVAVEPSEHMRAQLIHHAPAAAVLEGSAERIPLPDSSIDAVLVAQAWHWFGPAAIVEIARVLRAGGVVGELFNCLDDRVDWVAALRQLIEAAIPERPPTNWYTDHAGDHPVPELGAAYGEVRPQKFPYAQHMPVTGLLDLVSSYSYVIRLPEAERSRFLAQVGELANSHPELAGQKRIEIPYRTLTWRAVRR